jgi:hypothetical protein
MAAQMAHLEAMAELPNVDIRILPTSSPRLAVAHGSVTLLQGIGPDFAVEDGVESVIYHEAVAGVERIAERLEHIWAGTLSPAESVSVIGGTRKRYAT